ncbi:hypothetical protein PHMEG_00035175 [Phytophthora megakarya]|uniref:Uncharacterized protein n=1 Tax=Phytophthora megakarya TaxID=4795 RepID=A0A225UPP8_9STRA|nr:hypothetical protein PHMEG_00035175 [Phytophthora megakarya]
MFHAPRSKIHCTHIPAPFACCAPPRRKECEVKRSGTPDFSVILLKTRLTEAVGADWVARARAMASSGQVAKSSSGKSESPCSSEVLTRMKRTKNMFPEPMERFTLRRSVRSDARPNRNHSKHNSAAS